MDYLGHFSAPNKLRATRRRAWASYGLLAELDVRGGAAFHGLEWDGVEGASLVTLGMHIEIRVRQGRLGPGKVERIFCGLAPLDREDALIRAARPLAGWNWSVGGGRIPGAPSDRPWGGAGRVTWTPSGPEAPTDAREIARIDGWRPDSVTLSRRAPRRIVGALWRFDDLNVVLEMLRLPGVHVGPSLGRPLLPLFD